MENKDMKTLTKEEILDKHLFNKFDNTDKKTFLEAMQSFSDQETARLTAINTKKDELIEHLEWRILHHQGGDVWIQEHRKIKSELTQLQSRDNLTPTTKGDKKEVKCERCQDQTNGICPDCGKDHYKGRNV